MSYSKSHLLFIHLENLVKLTTRVFLAQFLTWFGHITFNEQQKKKLTTSIECQSVDRSNDRGRVRFQDVEMEENFKPLF